MADPVGDAEDALTELCRAVSAGVALDPKVSQGGGNRPLGGPSVEGVAQLDAAMVEHINALREAVAGAAAIVTQRVRDLDDAAAGERNRPKSNNDDSLADVLIRVGRDVLSRVLGGRS